MHENATNKHGDNHDDADDRNANYAKSLKWHAARHLAPEYSGRIAIDFLQQSLEVRRTGERLIGSPFQISELAEQAPFVRGGNESELGDIFISPVVGRQECRPTFE
jgi:hypothetical protein